MNTHIRFLALFTLGILSFGSFGGLAQVNEGVGEAQHKFVQQFIDVSLEELHLTNRFYPANLTERAKWLRYCKYGWEPCWSAIGTFVSPPDDRDVSLVCLEVKGLDGAGDGSDQYARLFSNKDYSLEIAPISECTRDLIDERTYTVSVVFSNCTGNKCSARTYVKRNREWCGTGWKTNKSIAMVDGYQFEILDGLREELLKTGSNQLIVPK